MPQTLYSLHTDGDQYRITKFVDGEVESSYLSTEQECECPAGHRASCRHRQMIPEMIARGLVNSHWFWNFDRHEAVDFNGQSKALLDNLDALKQAEQDIVEITGLDQLADIPGIQVLTLDDPATVHNAIADAVGEAQHVDWDQLAEERLGQVPPKPIVKTPLPRTNWRRL